MRWKLGPQSNTTGWAWMWGEKYVRVRNGSLFHISADLKWFAKQLVRALITKSHEVQLPRVNLFSLKDGRLGSDLILTFTIFRGEIDLDAFHFFFRNIRFSLRGYYKSRMTKCWEQIAWPVVSIAHQLPSQSWINHGVLYSRNLCIIHVLDFYRQIIYVSSLHDLIAIICVYMVFTGSYVYVVNTCMEMCNVCCIN